MKKENKELKNWTESYLYGVNLAAKNITENKNLRKKNNKINMKNKK